jgi:NDP-sugar pyrophosphorylase family protein
MREVRFRDLVSEDFLVVYADMITNVNLTQAITYHFDKKV